MSRRKDLQEAYEDALFALLMEDVIEEEGKRLAKENERLKDDPAAAVPEALHQRCRKTIAHAFGRRYRRETGKKTGLVVYRAFRQAAVIALICMILFGVAYAASPTLRVKTLNLLIEISDVRTTLSVGEEDNNEVGYDTSKAAEELYAQYGYRIPKLSEEFSLTEKLLYNTMASLIYETPSGEAIKFQLTKTQGGEYRIDTENAQRVEDITVGEHQGMLIAKDDWIRIVWSDVEQDMFVSVTGTCVEENALWEIVNAMNSIN